MAPKRMVSWFVFLLFAGVCMQWGAVEEGEGAELGLGADQAGQKTVRLEVDYGDGTMKVFMRLPFRAKMTVFQALEAAAKHPRGVTFKSRGGGATAFVSQIDDLKNEGRGDNWVFSVNGELGDRSVGVFAVKPGDTILWRYGKLK